MNTFNHKGLYECVCGKKFTESQKFNGHKSRCLDHLGIDRWTNSNILRLKKLKEAKQKSKLTSCLIVKICKNCGNSFQDLKWSKKIYCSRKCANVSIGKNKLTRKIIVAKPLKHKYEGPDLPILEKEILKKGYQVRSRMSYAEKFWQKVLDNNKISYEHDFKVKSDKKHGTYRLDFLIDNLYDLEIDGSFHQTLECQEKDKRRTSYLEKLGYKVYRIPWINPTTEIKKSLVNNQIDDLFKWLNKERKC